MSVQDEIPKSRLTLTYKTEVNGEPATIDLPLRLMFMGDLSLGSSKDRKVDLEERRMRSVSGEGLDPIMQDMDMSVEYVVPNKVDPEKAEDMKVNIPITGMRSFNPDEITQHIPKLKGLLLLKKLLLEVQSNVANKKEFRKLLSDLYSNEEAFQKVMEQMKGFESFKLPESLTKKDD